MDDREIIKLYNCRSEDALLETEKKYGKLVIIYNWQADKESVRC